MKPLSDQDRVESTATFIAAELQTLLDRDHKSHMNRRIREACPSYQVGLTNFEWVLATLRALSMVQIQLTADLGSLTTEPGNWLDDEAA